MFRFRFNAEMLHKALSGPYKLIRPFKGSIRLSKGLTKPFKGLMRHFKGLIRPFEGLIKSFKNLKQSP